MVRLDFPTTNNEVEYEAVVAGLDLAKVAGAESVVVYCDSQVVTNQINGDYECKGERMKRYLDQVRARIDDLEAKVIQIPRGENELADRLAKAALAEHMITPGNVLSFVQLSPLIDPGNMQEIRSERNWTTQITSYLKDGLLPEEKEAARKLKVQAARFVLIKDILYKRFLPSISKMPGCRRGRLRNEGSTRRDMREPFWIEVVGAQTGTSWVLLANHVEGCRVLH